MKAQACFVERCDEHRHDRGWVQVIPARQHTPTAHLRPQWQEAA